MGESGKIDTLIESVRKAGELLLELWPGSSKTTTALQIQEKSDGTLVSEADLRSNALLIAALRGLFPDDAILSEEIPTEPTVLAKAKRTWVVDPLDGTSSFLAGRDDFSILVALVENGVATTGIMFFPALGKLILATPDSSARREEELLTPTSTTELLPGRVYIRNFTCARPELASPMMDSGLALLKVASGELDGAIIKMTTHREWDLAAPAAVIASAGGCLTDETGAPIYLGRGFIDFKYAIASNGLIHKQLQGLIPA